MSQHFSTIHLESVLADLARGKYHGEITLPSFIDPLQLLQLISLDLPIGTIIVWRSKEAVSSILNIDCYHIPVTSNEFILNGFTQVSALFRVFMNPTAPALQPYFINNKTHFDEIFYDYRFDYFTYQKTNLDGLILVRDIYHLRSLLELSRHLELTPDNVYVNRIKDLHNRFHSYRLPVITLLNTDKPSISIVS